MKYFRFFVIILILLTGLNCYSWDNANIILVVDHSTSMTDYFEEVKQHIIYNIIPLLNGGDYFFYIEFGTDASVNYSDEIDIFSFKKLEIQTTVKSYRPTHNYTDIGLALETMFSTLEQVHDLNEKGLRYN